jgi:hypothetical protein
MPHQRETLPGYAFRGCRPPGSALLLARRVDVLRHRLGSETGAFRGVEGPRGFASYRAAVEASRFLMVGEPLSGSREESAC